MTPTDEMVRVAIRRANQLGYDLPYPLVEMMLTAALAAMWHKPPSQQPLVMIM